MRHWLRLGVCSVVVCLGALSIPLGMSAQANSQPPIGLWDGTIQGKAGEVNFGIDLQLQGKLIHATLVNATDRQPFSSATWNGGVLTLHLDYYDGTLTAHFVSSQRMEGEYSRESSKGVVHIPLVLVPHHEFAPGKAWTWPDTRWRLAVSSCRRRRRGEKHARQFSSSSQSAVRMAR